MRFLILAELSIIALGGMFTFTRQAQMLQQNSYFPSRYFKWLREEMHLRKQLLHSVFLAAALLLFFFGGSVALTAYSIFMLMFKITRARYLQKNSIKPLVYTARVKRQYLTLAVIYLALVTCGFLLHHPLFGVLIILLSYMPYVAVLLVRTINAPIENSFTAWYINDAKKMLKSHKNLTVIGVTGSYGKTSTKYVLAEFLSQKYNLLYTPASFNTPLGVVRTIREKLRPETQIFIAEMGAKNIGDIKEICDIVNPDLGVITSVGPQHLETFKTIENVSSTKFELADAVKLNGGKVFLNADNEYIKEKAGAYPSVCYGSKGDVSFKNVSYTPGGAQFDVVYSGGEIHINTKLLGLHNVSNITAAVALSLEMGVKPQDIAFAAARLTPVSHRLELKPFIGGATLLDDAYNANPVGCIEAVKVLGQFQGFKKVIVTPGLVELGQREYECNYNLGAAAAEECDVIILVGEQRAIPMKKAAEDKNFGGELHVVPSFAAALEILKGICNKETAVLIENDLPDNYSK